MGILKVLADFANPIGSLVGGVVNGVSNLISTNSTNEANKDINESQLAAQREYWKQQQENWLQERRWSLQDRAFENAYNSPAALKSRYLAAGINPYLAMQGQSAPASVQAVSPSAPNAPNVPSSIPMQSPDVSGFGLGISQMVATVLQEQASEREDYRLANDIEVSRINANANFMDAITKAKEAGVNEKFINHQIEDANNRYFLELDKFFLEKEERQARINVENERLDLEKAMQDMQEKLAEANIALDRSTMAKLAQEVKESKERVEEMRKNGASQRAIDSYIKRVQAATARIVEREDARKARNDIPGVRRGYQDFTEWLFAPLKGIISLGR